MVGVAAAVDRESATGVIVTGVIATIDRESASAVAAAVDQENRGGCSDGLRERDGVAAAVDRECPWAERGPGTPQKMAY